MQTTYAATITATALCLAAFSSLAQAPAPARPEAAKPAAAQPQTAKPVVRQITAPAPSAGEITDVVMYVGEVKTLPVRNVTRVAVGNGRLLTANVLDSEVLLLGEAPGDTSLFMWLKGGTIQRYKVRITGTDVNDNFTQLRAILGDLPGIKLERVGDAVVVSGNTSKVNLQRIEATLKAFPRVLNLAREEEVTLKRMVYMKVQIMEFKKTALGESRRGLADQYRRPGRRAHRRRHRQPPVPLCAQTQDPTFTPGQGAAVPLSTASQPLRGYLGIASVITSRLNLAVQNGDAWILASPELSTRSGGEAKFLAGGQVPLPTVSATGQSSVTFKDYGIRMTLKPNVDDANNIAASLETELSAIDPSVTVQGIPGFTTRQTNSEINVKSGQTIVISGLVNQNLANTIDKFPFLGDVPVLGALFKSTNFTARAHRPGDLRHADGGRRGLDRESAAAGEEQGHARPVRTVFSARRVSSTDMFTIALTTPKGEQSKIQCAADTATIGKGDDNVVVLQGWTIGKRQASIHRRDGGFLIEDHGGMQTTDVNGRSVKGAQPISPADEIAIGGYKLRLVPEAAAAAPSPAASTARPEAAAVRPAAPPPPAVAAKPAAKAEPQRAAPPPPPPPPAASPAAHAAAISGEAKLMKEARAKVHGRLIQTMDLRRVDVAHMNEAELRTTTRRSSTRSSPARRFRRAWTASGSASRCSTKSSASGRSRTCSPIRR